MCAVTMSAPDGDHLPCIGDSRHIALLEGQRYVVLRPDPEVSSAYATVRSAVQPIIAHLPVSCPARAHVTLHGFPAGTTLAQVRALVGSWAATVPPLRLEVDGVSVFPPPFKTVVVR